MNEPPTIVVGASDEGPAPAGRGPGAATLVAAVVLILGVLWALGRVAPLDEDYLPMTVRLVGSSAVEMEPRFYEISRTGVSEIPLPNLMRAEFDRSGRLLAGIAPSEADRGGVLSVGPPEGPFEPLSDEVRSFAWHDRLPGSLAYVSPWGPVAAISTWEEGASTRERAIEGGLMHRFGDWGYAVTRPGPVRRADLYDASGRFGGQVRGYTAGTGPGEYLVFTPQAPVSSLERTGVEAFGYTPEGTPFDVPWLEEGELPYVIEAAPDGQRYAVHLGGRYETGLGEVLITRPDGTLEAKISRAATPAASAWSTDGRYLAVTRRGLSGELEIGFYDLKNQTFDVASVPEVPSSIVVWDIAVADTG
jgi:hypothetical protein